MTSTRKRRATLVLAPVLLALVFMGASPGKLTVCHKGSDLSIGLAGIVPHLIHGDRIGSCTVPPPPQCEPGDGGCWT